ncbi:hypothetical protein BDV96DRAFT_591112 [Lophiotrema nucula]|uniref:Uncharacterized protein n=1 Tax=Lophiotrema nucula TaxID=690887 RepID=A0A6A5YH24_9PLEO|nr:hypothetical protein BDV96DRAFT_591112 [Lophiotrema nucula]
MVPNTYAAYYCLGTGSKSVDLTFDLDPSSQGYIANFTQTIYYQTSPSLYYGTVLATIELPQMLLFDPTTSRTSFHSTIPSNTDPAEAAERKATGISSGAKIAIGISIPFICIVIALVAFLFIRRRRRKHPSSQPSYAAVNADDQIKPELEGDQGHVSGQEQYKKAELHANQEHQPGELEAGANVGEIVRYELPSEAERRDV